jgi:hypothetical protein
MIPYYQDDVYTLYTDDCRDVLPGIAADDLITDPPFVVRKKVELRGKGVAPMKQVSTTIGNQGWLYTKDWLPLALATGVRQALVFGGFRDVGELLAAGNPDHLKGILTWRKTNAPLPAWNSPRYDTTSIVWWGSGTNPPGMNTLKSMVLDYPFPVAGAFASERFVDATKKSVHPSQAPLALMMDLIERFTQPGDTVLDPFAGTGTTLVAARNLGRKAIGIEVNQTYCALVVKRLRDGERQRRNAV